MHSVRVVSYTVTSIGNAVASDSFSSNDSETVTNTGHANISQILTSTDAAGTTKNVNVSSKTNFGLTGFGTASDSDSGSYTLTEVNGLPASFVENDTAIQSSDFTPWSQVTTNAHIVVVSSDPVTGMVTTSIFDDRGSTDNTSSHKSEHSTDTHSGFLTTPGQAAITENDIVTGGDLQVDNETILIDQIQTTKLVGTDARGNVFDIKEVESKSSSGTEVFTVTDSRDTSGTNVETLDDYRSIGNYSGIQVTGTISKIDPTTGIKTSTAYQVSFFGGLADTAENGESITTTSAGVATTVPTISTEVGSDQLSLTVHNVMTQTNPNGTPAAAPKYTDATTTDVELSTNDVITHPTNSLTPVPFAAASAAAGTPPPQSQLGTGNNVAQSNIMGVFHGIDDFDLSKAEKNALKARVAEIKGWIGWTYMSEADAYRKAGIPTQFNSIYAGNAATENSVTTSSTVIGDGVSIVRYIAVGSNGLTNYVVDGTTVITEHPKKEKSGGTDMLDWFKAFENPLSNGMADHMRHLYGDQFLLEADGIQIVGATTIGYGIGVAVAIVTAPLFGAGLAGTMAVGATAAAAEYLGTLAIANLMNSNANNATLSGVGQAAVAGAIGGAIGWGLGKAGSAIFGKCFPAGTPVSTEEGLRPIETIRPGDRVWAFDHANGAWKLKSVLQNFQREYQTDMVHATIGGETIQSTMLHPYWVTSGADLADRPMRSHLEKPPEHSKVAGRWVDATDLRVGDRMLLRDEREAFVEAVKHEAANTIVYNFSVDELRCYAVGTNQILVHNSNGLDEVVPKRISNVPDRGFVPNPSVPSQYARPRGAGPTAAQRAAVQGKPCVECGMVTPKQVADHIDPLVVQHYRDGAVDVAKQSMIDAVQPHCPTCSAIQGGMLSGFSKRIKSLLGW